MNRILALVKRALQTDSRQVHGHLVRLTLGALILWFLFYTHQESWMTTAPGLTLFWFVMYCNYFVITIAGAAFFAMAITEEKEERTLSLLRMAGVGSTSLILGKWIPRLIGACLLLSVQIPFTILAITLGGVLWDQVAASYLSLFAHLFLIGNLGLLASVLMSTTTSACGLVFGLLIARFVVPSILAAIFFNANNTTIGSWVFSFNNFIGETSCFMRISTILATGFNDSWWSTQVISNFVAGAILFVASWLLFDVCTRNEKEPGTIGMFDRLRRVRTITKRGRAWDSALIWKDYQLLGGGTTFLLVKFLIYLVIFVGFVLLAGMNRMPDREEIGAVIFGYSLFFFIIEAAIVMSRVFRKELSEKTWSTLVLLPRSTREIAYAKTIGGLSATLPLVFSMGTGVLLMGEEFWEGVGSLIEEPGALLALSYFCLQVLLGIHMATYFSIVAKWGVWPLSISLGAFLVIAANVLVISCIAMGGAFDGFEALALVGCLITGGIMFGVHSYIGERLSSLAAE